MKTITGQEGVNYAIFKEYFDALLSRDEITYNAMMQFAYDMISVPGTGVIISGLNVLPSFPNSLISDGFVMIENELLFFHGGTPLPKFDVVPFAEIEKNVIDGYGNPCYTKISGNYCQFAQNGAYNFADLVRADPATKSNPGTAIFFPTSNADQPFTISTVNISKKTQFSRYFLNMNVASTSIIWATGWHRITTLPAGATPSADRYMSATIYYTILGTTSYKTVSIRALASGNLELFFAPDSGDSLAINVIIQIEYDL